MKVFEDQNKQLKNEIVSFNELNNIFKIIIVVIDLMNEK